MTTHILSLDEIDQNQLSKYLSHNNALQKLEALLVRLISRTTTAEPTGVNGNVYIVPAGATGASWSGEDGNIAHYYAGSYKFYTPIEGYSFWVNDENVTITYDGTNWTSGILFADSDNIAFDTTTGSKIGTATGQKIGFWNVTPVIQPASANQAAVTLGNTDGEIGGLTIGATYTQSEVQALRDKCEELADDVRNLSVLIHSLRTAGVDSGLIKGAA